MRSIKALWRLAVGRRENRPESHTSHEQPPRREPSARQSMDKTDALLNAEPPTRTLQ